MVKAAFFNQNLTGGNVDYVFAAGRQQRIAGLCDLYPVRISKENFDAEAKNLQDLEVIFSTWGMPSLSPEQLDQLPALKAVFYAAGSVKGFARPFLERGIVVSSAVSANAIPVAEFCLAQILLSAKRYFANTRCFGQKEGSGQGAAGRGVYGETVALIGIGEVSRKLIEFLKPFTLRVVAADRLYLEEHPESLRGVELAGLVTLEEAFREGYIVSNHLPNLESNQKIITEAHFASMRENATFINTGRGAQVDEAGLIRAMKARPDLTALLDVTFPEPPETGSELYSLPNVQLSSHIAGSLNDEVIRMADTMIAEFLRFQAGEALQYAISLEMFDDRA